LAKTRSYGENLTKSSVALHNAYDIAFIFILMMQPCSLNRSTSLLIRLFWRRHIRHRSPLGTSLQPATGRVLLMVWEGLLNKTCVSA